MKKINRSSNDDDCFIVMGSIKSLRLSVLTLLTLLLRFKFAIAVVPHYAIVHSSFTHIFLQMAHTHMLLLPKYL